MHCDVGVVGGKIVFEARQKSVLKVCDFGSVKE
jgi:hypothetical protein